MQEEGEEGEGEGPCPGHSVRNSARGQEVARHVRVPLTSNPSQLCTNPSIPAYFFFPGGSDDERIRLPQVRSLGQEDPPEKEMATQSSTLACRIPRTWEPGELQPTGLQKVGPN